MHTLLFSETPENNINVHLQGRNSNIATIRLKKPFFRLLGTQLLRCFLVGLGARPRLFGNLAQKGWDLQINCASQDEAPKKANSYG